jgi:hypothetical protein
MLHNGIHTQFNSTKNCYKIDWNYLVPLLLVCILFIAVYWMVTDSEVTLVIALPDTMCNTLLHLHNVHFNCTRIFWPTSLFCDSLSHCSTVQWLAVTLQHGDSLKEQTLSQIFRELRNQWPIIIFGPLCQSYRRAALHQSVRGDTICSSLGSQIELCVYVIRLFCFPTNTLEFVRIVGGVQFTAMVSWAPIFVGRSVLHVFGMWQIHPYEERYNFHSKFLSHTACHCNVTADPPRSRFGFFRWRPTVVSFVLHGVGPSLIARSRLAKRVA